MLSTSLAKDLYKSFVRRDADDARLLRVARLTSVVAGAAGVALAIALPSVLDALRIFYAVMTVTLFVPLVAALAGRRPGARWARAGIVAGGVATVITQLGARGTAHAGWLPYVAGIAVSASVFAAGAVADRRVSPA
jgi:SSS family solute:Na+ symporter